MADIFLSYKREDEIRVGRLARALEGAGLKLWWDRGLPGGESWRANLQSALDAAKCVIVAWTHESVGPAGDFVRDEAGQAKVRGILVPVLLERVRAPLGFGEVQAIDLAHWRGDARDPFFLDLVAAVRAKLEGRPAPPARGPVARLDAGRLTIGSVASALTAGLFAFAMDFTERAGSRLRHKARPARARRYLRRARPRRPAHARSTHRLRGPAAPAIVRRCKRSAIPMRRARCARLSTAG